MALVAKYDNYGKLNSTFSREHDKIIKKYGLDFISLRGTKIALIGLYEIVFTLFENNAQNLKISDIILLSLASIGILSKENNEDVKKIVKSLEEKKLIGYFILVKNTVKSLKNLLNIIFKKEGVVILNIEQGLKYRYAIDALNITLNYIREEKTSIKDFCYWYIVDHRDKPSKDLIDYININYYM